MEDINEQAKQLIEKYEIKSINHLIKTSLAEQNRRWSILKKVVIEMEGACIRAGLPINKIEYKGKNQKEWRKWDSA